MCDDDGEICESAPTPTSTTADGQHQQQQQQTKNRLKVEQVEHWQEDELEQWLSSKEHFSRALISCLSKEAIDGKVLLTLTESDVRDLRYKLGYVVPLGELKRFWLHVSHLQQQWTQVQRQQLQQQQQLNSGLTAMDAVRHVTQTSCDPGGNAVAGTVFMSNDACPAPPTFQECPGYNCSRNAQRDFSSSSSQCLVAPEYFKTAVSLGYSFVVTWITSFVMVIVHERVPDMKRYPPLPDIFLDNVPHIPWAFNMCEITGSLLFTVWLIVLIFHKYRMVLLRRFFALAGTVFLLRCVTMLITSLSVPGTHLQCNQKDFAIDDPNVDMIGALIIRMTRAYRIWSGLGMSIQGVRTCGDYMFSGHTVALTLLNFFITEYTPRNLYFLHTMTWLLNMFGIFFILAAHEHYSIDVFVAFYITSRLFLYYHTLANNRALMQSDSTRTRVWFPMFSYFENHVDGMIPNEFDTPGSLVSAMVDQLLWVKDQVVWLTQHISLPKANKSLLSTGTDLCNHSIPHSAHNMNNVRTTTRPSTPIKLSPQPIRRTVTSDIPTPIPSVSLKRANVATSQQVKRTLVDVSVSPYASEMVKKDSKESRDSTQAAKKQL